MKASLALHSLVLVAWFQKPQPMTQGLPSFTSNSFCLIPGFHSTLENVL